MTTTLKARFAAILVALFAVLGTSIVAAQPAQAAYVGNVYLVFPKWLGNCPNGGEVKRVWAANGYATWNWDRGDDIVYGPSLIGGTSRVNFSLFCQTSWIGTGYYQSGFTTTYYASRTGQAIYIGLAGVRY